MPANSRTTSSANGQRTQTAPVWVRNDEIAPDGQCRHFATMPGGTARCWRAEEHEEAGKPHEPGLGLVPPMVTAMEETIAQIREEGTWEQTDGPQVNEGQDLIDWWHRTADDDLKMLMPKALEYSAHDLRMTGHILADLMGIAVDDAFAAELACATYLMSKMTRVLGAYKEGRLPSIDSITDARVYATMMARIRERGSWPGWENAI